MTTSQPRTRYGDLIGDATQDIARAAATVSCSPFADADTARETIDAYKSLLSAVHRHAWELAGGPTRITGIGASAHSEQRDLAAVRFIDSLAAATRARTIAEQRPAAGAGRMWTQAARSIRTATDLLCTHRDPEGAWRTPDSWVLDDPDTRAASLAEIADLAATVLAAEPRVGLRAGQAGVRWSEVAQSMPDLSRARVAATDLVDRTRSDGGGGATFAELEVARPQLRTADPLTDLGDRILRLRHHAWELTKEPMVGVVTLTDFAAAGVIVHAHAAGYLAGRAPGGINELPTRSMLRRAEAGQATWSLIHLQTRQLRTATPGVAIVRHDVLAIRDLWKQVLPVGPEARREIENLEPRDARALVNGSVRALSDIARWNAAVFDDLSASGQLLVPSRTLTGDQVSDDPRLIATKLRGRVAPAPAERIDQLTRMYAIAAANAAITLGTVFMHLVGAWMPRRAPSARDPAPVGGLPPVHQGDRDRIGRAAGPGPVQAGRQGVDARRGPNGRAVRDQRLGYHRGRAQGPGRVVGWGDGEQDRGSGPCMPAWSPVDCPPAMGCWSSLRARSRCARR